MFIVFYSHTCPCSFFVSDKSGHGSCTYSIEAGEELNVSVYTRSTSGAKFTVCDANHGKAPWVENFEVKHLGTDDVSETPSHMSLTGSSNIMGPQHVKVKADSNGGRWSSTTYLVVFTVYNIN